MAGNGGARLGAGRKRDADKYGGHVEAAKQQIVQSMPALVGNMLVLANGFYQEKTLPDGETVIVYKTPPDRQANEYLLNRIMGKPTERIEEEHSGGLTIKVEFEDIGPAEDDHAHPAPPARLAAPDHAGDGPV